MSGHLKFSISKVDQAISPKPAPPQPSGVPVFLPHTKNKNLGPPAWTPFVGSQITSYPSASPLGSTFKIDPNSDQCSNTSIFSVVGCSDKVPQTWWPKQQKFSFLGFWRLTI